MNLEEFNSRLISPNFNDKICQVSVTVFLFIYPRLGLDLHSAVLQFGFGTLNKHNV